jgi:hypothetical protein
MSDVFVDLRYRGLPLANRVRLTELAVRELYLEVPAPMPVGTVIAIDGDEPTAVGGDARVLEVFEQTAGSERPPGMRVRRLAADGAPRSAPAAAATASRSTVDDPGTAAPATAAKEVTEVVAPPLPEALAAPVAPAQLAIEATTGPEVAETTEVTEVMEAVAPPPTEEILAVDPGEISRSIAIDGEVEEDGPAPSESPGAAPRGRKRRRGNRR